MTARVLLSDNERQVTSVTTLVAEAARSVASLATAEARGVETDGVAPGHKVGGMVFGYDASKVQAAIEATRAMPGIGYVRVWLASGELAVGDDIMLVLIGGDIRPHVVDALQALVGTIKNECVSEVEREA